MPKKNIPEDAVSTYEKIKDSLKGENYTYESYDVIKVADTDRGKIRVAMKVYVAPDPQNDHKPDFDGWFKAYAEFFNNESNPNKVARSTIGVYTLVNPDMLIEIEVRAVYP